MKRLISLFLAIFISASGLVICFTLPSFADDLDARDEKVVIIDNDYDDEIGSAKRNISGAAESLINSFDYNSTSVSIIHIDGTVFLERGTTLAAAQYALNLVKKEGIAWQASLRNDLELARSILALNKNTESKKQIYLLLNGVNKNTFSKRYENAAVPDKDDNGNDNFNGEEPNCRYELTKDNGTHPDCDTNWILDYSKKFLSDIKITPINFAPMDGLPHGEFNHGGDIEEKFIKELASPGEYHEVKAGETAEFDSSKKVSGINGAFNKKHTVSFSASTIDKLSNPNLQMETDWNSDWFGKNPATYNNDLAKTLLLLDANANTNIPNAANKTVNTIKDFGFGDVECKDYSGVIGINGLHYCMAQQKIIISGKQQNLFLLLCVGTTGFGEWVGNLAGGVISYKNGEVVAFAEPASVALADFTNFAKKHHADKSNDLFIVTGHSRGGAVSNIVGHNLVKSGYPKNHLFVYGFAVPNTVSEDDKVSKDDTVIHSVVNYGDAVSYLPPMSTKYGLIWGYDGINKIPDNAMLDIIRKTNPDYKKLEYTEGFGKSGFWQHEPLTYLGFMNSEMPETYDSGKLDQPKVVVFHCPLDIVVRKGDKLVGEITNNQVNSNSEILLGVNGDDKWMILPQNVSNDYTIEATATEKAKVSFEIFGFDKKMEYKNVSLLKNDGIEIYANIDTLYQPKLNRNNESIGLINEDGKIDYANSWSSVETLFISVGTTTTIIIVSVFALIIIGLVLFIFRTIRKIKKRKNKKS